MASNFESMLFRRAFLGRASAGLGMMSLAALLDEDQSRAATPDLASPMVDADHWHGAVQPIHLPAKAKRVIFLYMSGGPSQFETFDNKPKLAELSGQPMPESVTAGQPIAQLQGQKLNCLGPMYKFKRWGQSQQEISEHFPHIGSIADDICIVRSMHTDQINHDPAHTVMNTGTSISGRPSMGSWVTYGLGSEARDLPGFVVLTSKGGRDPQPISMRQWHSGFLPSRFQGVEFYSTGDPVHYVRNPDGVDATRQRGVVDAIQTLDRMRNEMVDNPELATRISQYEMAFRMQSSVPGLMDFSDEPASVLEMYGAKGLDGSFAANCLLARRMAERGVRFIQLYHRGWDHHNDLARYLPQCAGFCDQASAALVNDLKQRGMLDETLIIWGGEFGRTPMAQSNKGGVGRDHHMRSFSIWLAGGGIRGGMTYGETDDFGYHAAVNPVHVSDLHATMLHQLGIDHKRLTYRFQGRDFRLTDVAGEVVKPILS
jgi:hypothetical protein